LRQFFSCCGAVTAIRLCGDSARPARFAFVEFDTREAAVAAIGLSNTTLGNHPIRISPSKSSIQKRTTPVPSSPEILERVSRTIHVGNLDASVCVASLP
jgi:RNA recognition motif-containing protein